MEMIFTVPFLPSVKLGWACQVELNCKSHKIPEHSGQWGVAQTFLRLSEM